MQNLSVAKEGRLEPPSEPNPCAGRFTARDGFLGWLQAKRRRSPVYGPGSISCGPVDVALYAWRRTWLGVPHRDEVRLSLDGICNVTCENRRVEFEYRKPYRLRRRIHFTADSETAARELAARLPVAQSPGFQKQWSELSNFKARLAELGGHTRATSSLVLVNLAVFAAMAVSERRLGAFDPSFLLTSGANFGAFTVNGQWWRLLTSLFVHLNLLHLLVNLWALWNVGRLAERLYGTGTFVFLYFASGLLGSLASIAWEPGNISAGASGAIFGILGSHLAFLAHRESGVPRQIVRAHWLSTLVFVLFNLFRGALAPGVDNAAHVGGLAGGLVLGWILVRPLDPESRQEFPLHKSVAAVFVLGAAILLGLAQVLGLGSQLTPSEQYARSHEWYLRGQTSNLVLWQELAVQAASGSVSDAEVGTRFEKEIVPFWVMADARLKKEAASLPADQKDYAALVADFTQLRLQWAQTIVQATRNQDQQALAQSTELLKQTELAQARLERVELRDNMSHHQRALADSPLVVRLRALFARRPTCVQWPLAYGPRVAAADAPGDGPAVRDQAGCRAQQMFIAGDYATLDAWMSRAARSLGDLPDGSSTLSGIAAGLSALMSYGGLDLRALLGRTADWRRVVPGSVQAELIESIVFRSWAWGARGNGSANEVTQQSWILFAHRSEMAAAGLRDIRGAADNPLWYQLSIEVGLDQGRDADALQTIFRRGAAAFPNYWPLYRSMLRALMPRWGGSYLKVDNFIDDVSYGLGDFPPGVDPKLDEETYAELYWIYSSLEYDSINIFQDAFATWPHMKAGLTLMLQHHPASDAVVNGFARFACIAGDAEQYKQLRSRLARHYSATSWSTKVTLESCDRKFIVADTVKLRP